ncbi:MAG TPA: PKD domain-containing protein [Bacteroidales bacterium]|nr:PKD domain-containing protein [Bacteroidales bacterium]
MKKSKGLLLKMFLFSLIISVVSCQKEDSSRETSNLRNTSAYDIESLMKEEIVIEMLNVLKPYSFKVNNKGIFEFDKISDLDSVLNILSRYANKLDDPKDIYPNDPVLFAFEYHYGFKSLRNAIDQEVIYLENLDMLTEFNDPDNDKIVGDDFRSILTPNRELIVEDIICVYLDSITVGIHNYNYDALRDVHGAYLKSGVSGIAELCLQRDIVTLPADMDLRTMVIDFYYVNINNNSLSYRFTPIVNYTNENPNHFSYYWQFDDGQSSTEREPTHTFAASGEFSVKLTVTYGGSGLSTEKDILVGSCNANFTSLSDQDIVGKYYFTNTSTASIGNIVSYDWYFGDNTPHVTTQSPSHAYSTDGTYIVKLVISTDAGCTDSFESTLHVSGSGDCCVMYDKEKDTTRTYASGTRKAKLVIKIVNVWPVHGFASKTINYRVKNNGSLALEKADKITTTIAGFVYATNCTDYAAVDQGEVKYNKNKATYTYYQTHTPLRVRKNGLFSGYYVKDNDGTSTGNNALSLHQKNCN